MGQEFGQWREWNHDRSLDWHLLDDPAHAALRRYVQTLNSHYRAEAAPHECDFDPSGFRWIDCHDNENSVISFARAARDRRNLVVMVFNFTPVPRDDYRIGVPEPGFYAELLNSDSSLFGGTNVGNGGGVSSEPIAAHGFDHSIGLTLPPLACLFLKKRGRPTLMSRRSSRAAAVALVTFATFTDIVAYSIAVPVLPDMSRRLGASPTMIGLLFASFGVTLLTVSMPMGAASDRIGRKAPLVVVLVALGAASAI